ncbi:FPR3 [Candida metapsilosis]|uniref:FK506-binding protein n=1 Tax=Candida metapsilosis TaxID=273372 RepID=A0A8H7ZD51_9ASCO|nr:FPR3 [Candida metapsilosis]
MSQLTPIATYNLALKPFQALPAIEEDFPVTIRLTLASLDPEAEDDKAEPSTLRILKKTAFGVYDDSEDDEDDEDEEDEEDELDDEEVAKKANGSKDDIEEDDEEEEKEEDDDEEVDEDDEEDDDDLDDDVSEFVVCTLSPQHQYQQTLDLTITPDEEVFFVVTGSYPIHLTGNYIEHPADESDDEDEEYGEYDDEYDLSPDEDEIIHGIDFNEDYDEEEDDDEESAEPGKIQEILDAEEAESNGDANKKRALPQEESKKSKKAKKNAAKKEEKKSVQFSEELEQGPTGSTLAKEKKEKKSAESDKASKKYPTKTLLGGVITEDRKIGSGPTAKSGNKVGIRYIGKLKNGKVFDKNTSGKPFSFKLGKGECIKGFDLGVTGMSVGGERRVVIPAKMGYGSQALPGIPANSELTFDIKLVSLK